MAQKANAKPQEKKTGKRVLIALDGSIFSSNAFQWYVNNARLPTDEIILAYCVTNESSVLSETPDVLSSKEEEKVQQTLAAIQYLAYSHKVEHTIERLYGSPGEAIIKASKDLNASMIVAGSRGFSKMRKTPKGSISTYIFNNAQVPVLICKHGLHLDTPPNSLQLPTNTTRRFSLDIRKNPDSPTKERRPSFDMRSPVEPAKLIFDVHD